MFDIPGAPKTGTRAYSPNRPFIFISRIGKDPFPTSPQSAIAYREGREAKLAYQYWVPPKIVMGEQITVRIICLFSRKITWTKGPENN